MLIAAAIITVLIGSVHSYLGETSVLIPLFKRAEMPNYIKRLLRVAWHMTSLFWLAIAAQFAAMALYPGQERQSFVIIMAVTFGLSTLIALLASKGKHLSWIGFGAATILLVYQMLSSTA